MTQKKLNRVLQEVRSYAQIMRDKSDEELSGLTEQFKQRLAKGETLDDLLPEAFAAICEADGRILGKYPYDVQVLGAIALHQCYLAEMNTGEGKTLVATMPLYLNALTGKSTILVTTNDYLAIRDAQEMGQVYQFMGLSVRAGASRDEEKKLTNDEKRDIYAADIVYTTHGTLGFDYLFNNLVSSKEERFMREFNYVIIDEADSVLLDAAQMPLVIAGSPRVQSNFYELADLFVTTLVEEVDYKKEEKNVWLTDEGIRRAEVFFQIDNFYGGKHFELNRHVNLALRAHTLYVKGKDYVVSEEGEITLLDGGSGRVMPGVKLHSGLHQALEAREHIVITQETRSMASITYQNLFLLFPRMSGMSGTIADARTELLDVYGKKMIRIPTNHPIQRIDYHDLYFQSTEELLQRVIGDIARAHSTGRPVLVVASTISDTELISKLLVEDQIPHSVLNANNAFWEATIIAEAGQMNAVTVATSMAGRGTDIKLGEGVKELGGLAVFGVGRMNNTRLERQARGRAGRQGDPGSSQFYVSLQDEIVTDNSSSKLEKYISGKKHASKLQLKMWIDGAQKTSNDNSGAGRRSAFAYDEVMQKQRELIYSVRDDLLNGGSLEEKAIYAIAENVIDEFLEQEVTRSRLCRFILDTISYTLERHIDTVELSNQGKVRSFLLLSIRRAYNAQARRMGSPEQMSEFVRIATLKALDDAWIEQVDFLGQLKSAVSGRSSAQRNPIYEYQTEALESFNKMVSAVKRNALRNILLGNCFRDEEGKMQLIEP